MKIRLVCIGCMNTMVYVDFNLDCRGGSNALLKIPIRVRKMIFVCYVNQCMWLNLR